MITRSINWYNIKENFTVQKGGNRAYFKYILVNAYILFRKYTSKKNTIIRFKDEICLQIFVNFVPIEKPRKLRHKLIKGTGPIVQFVT